MQTIFIRFSTLVLMAMSTHSLASPTPQTIGANLTANLTTGVLNNALGLAGNTTNAVFGFANTTVGQAFDSSGSNNGTNASANATAGTNAGDRTTFRGSLRGGKREPQASGVNSSANSTAGTSKPQPSAAWGWTRPW